MVAYGLLRCDLTAKIPAIITTMTGRVPMWYWHKVVKDSTSKPYECLFCHKTFTNTDRIGKHLLGQVGVGPRCPGPTNAESSKLEALLKIYEDAIATYTVAQQSKHNKRKINQDAAIALARGKQRKLESSRKQPTLSAIVGRQQCAEADNAIAAMIFETNVAMSVVEHPAFREMVSTLTKTTATYRPPMKDKVRARLLDRQYDLCKHDIDVKLATALKVSGGTLMIDGWRGKDHIVSECVVIHISPNSRSRTRII